MSKIKIMSIIEKALSDAFVAGKSKQLFADFKKEWMMINAIDSDCFDIEKLIKKLELNKKRGFKKVMISDNYLLLEK